MKKEFDQLTEELTEWFLEGDDYDGQHLSYEKLYTEALVNDMITAATFSDAWKHYDRFGMWKKEVKTHANC